MAERIEEKQDFTAEVDAKIPEATTLSENGKLAQGLELLMGVERSCRTGNDRANLTRVVLALIKLCRTSQDWDQLNTTLTLVAKRRGQHSQAVKAMVEEATAWLAEPPTKEGQNALLVTLRDITDGKIFLEGERARLTRLLADEKEKEGDIEGAAAVLQEVHVETYGALDKQEKADFILEQIRLTLAKKDYIRALIQSRKINRKTMLDEDMQDLKVRFYKLMVEYNTHEKDPWELCNDFHSIYNTKKVQEAGEEKEEKEGEMAVEGKEEGGAAAQERWKEALSSSVLFLVLSPHTNEQQDMLYRVVKDAKLEELPAYKELLRLFTTPEIIGYPLAEQEQFESHPCLSTGGPELLTKWKEDFKTRVVQHNIRVVSKYYTQIRSSRLSELLGLELDETETHVSGMVSEGSLYAKINRPAGRVVFAKPQPAEEILSSWNNDISSLLGLVERTCHLINKESMLHKVASK